MVWVYFTDGLDMTGEQGKSKVDRRQGCRLSSCKAGIAINEDGEDHKWGDRGRMRILP